jgi:hypothetical protein
MDLDGVRAVDSEQASLLGLDQWMLAEWRWKRMYDGCDCD